jgi:hypothetical protein
MQDDQWPAPPRRGNGEREQRPRGGNSGALPGQGQGATRPPNTTGQYTPGRPGGNPNTSGFGQSSYTNSGSTRSQGPWRDDSWGPADRSGSSQRRGNSGPINSAGRGPSYSSPLGSDPRRRSGGLDQGGRGGGGWEDDDRWQGGGSSRTSRSLSSPLGRPGQGGPTGNGRGSTGQWGANARGWEDDDADSGWGTRSRQPRSTSGQLSAGGRGGQGAMNKSSRNQGQDRSGTTVRGNWVIEPEDKIRAPGQTLRTRLLLSLLAAVIVLGAAVAFVPSARHRLLSFLPGNSSNTSGSTTTNGATLTVQVNVPNATVTVDNKTSQKTSAGQTAPFSFATFQGVTAGKHTLNIQANTYAPATGSITMGTADTTVTAWLVPTADALKALLQFAPATQPDPGAAGDHYTATAMANGKITINIKYTLSGLDPNAFTSQLVASADTTTSPFKPVALAFAPTITFTDANGKTLQTTSPAALPTTQFSVQVTLGADSKGMPAFISPTAMLSSNIKAQFPGAAGQDLLLDFALASAFPSKTVQLTCLGAANPQNPEDGLFLTEAGGGHFYYRWGLLWATNGPAFTLAPNAPHALSGTKEFVAATAIETGANPTCGS